MQPRTGLEELVGDRIDRGDVVEIDPALAAQRGPFEARVTRAATSVVAGADGEQQIFDLVLRLDRNEDRDLQLLDLLARDRTRHQESDNEDEDDKPKRAKGKPSGQTKPGASAHAGPGAPRASQPKAAAKKGAAADASDDDMPSLVDSDRDEEDEDAPPKPKAAKAAAPKPQPTPKQAQPKQAQPKPQQQQQSKGAGNPPDSKSSAERSKELGKAGTDLYLENKFVEAIELLTQVSGACLISHVISFAAGHFAEQC